MAVGAGREESASNFSVRIHWHVCGEHSLNETVATLATSNRESSPVIPMFGIWIGTFVEQPYCDTIVAFFASNAKSVGAVPSAGSIDVRALVKQHLYNLFVALLRGFKKCIARAEPIVEPCVNVRIVFLQDYTNSVCQTFTASRQQWKFLYQRSPTP
jgi:hypothetical protein